MKALRKPLFSAFLGAATIGLVTADSFSGKKITDIQVKYSGDKTVDAQRIINQMSSSVGTKYNADKLDTDIRKLYKSGLVDNVSISGVNHNSGVKLIANVSTRPILASIAFVGNSKFQNKTLARKSKLVTGKILGASDVLAAKSALKEYYYDFDYPDIKISHSIQKTTKKGYANLVFTIDEGAKNTIKKITFEGNKAFDHNLLLKEIETRKKGLFSFINNNGQIDHNKLAEDVEKIVDFYKNNGYLRASSPGARFTSTKKGKLELIIPINEGVKYSVNSISFANMKQFTPEQLLPTFVLDAGDPYSQSQLREDIITIRAYYGSRGFADVKINPKITNASGNKINIKYDITEGGPSKVGKINISGNAVTKDYVIRREASLKPGKPFNSVELDTIKNRLRSLNYFDPVYVDSTSSSLSGHRDLNIQVKDKQTGSLSFGVAFSSIDSLVGFVGLEQRNFDLFNWRTFRGGGQQFKINLRAGGETTDIRVSLIEPWFLGKKLEAGVELYYQDLLFLSSEYDLTKGGGAVHLRKAIGKKSSLRAELRWERNEVELEDLGLDPNSDFQQFAGEFDRTEFTISYIYDSRNARITARRGHKIDVGLSYSVGDAETYSIYARGSKYWNFKHDLILNLRGEIATTEAYGSNDLVPIFDRHFLGGSRNLRGFEFNDIGSRDSVSNEVFGGASTAYFTTELTFPLVDSIRGAVFSDIGSVSEDSFSFLDDIYADVGVGLRLNLPIGPLAIDYAVPINSPDEVADNGGQFNFYISTSF